MKLSTRGRYGLRAIFDLALNQYHGPIPLNEIATRQKISESYLEQLFSSMRKAGLVKSVRGSQGGYLLGAYPNEIYVGQVLRALEGSIAPADCVSEDKDSLPCDGIESCATREVWRRIRESIKDVVDTTTLEDMINDYDGLNTMTHLKVVDK